jgi:tRNA pseudouridine55 synthase
MNAFGFLNIDKPVGLTSHTVVARVRQLTGIKRIGHAGTLDPLADGVLVLCVGAAARLSEYVMHTTKQYRARVHLGRVTDTYDAEGQIISECDVSGINLADVQNLLPRFTGEIEQLPPMYSAVKQGGRKLYELARAGQTVERQPRRVTVERLSVAGWHPPFVELDIVCSAGTYIRSLACDLGDALGVGASLAGLTRTASGSFRLESAVSLDSLLVSSDWRVHLITPAAALPHLPAVTVSADQANDLRHGRPVPASGTIDATIALAYTADGALVAVLQALTGLWKPQKVFAVE